MHPVENTEWLAQVHQNKPGGEAKKLFPEAVLELRVDSERGDDPQLQGEDALLTFINVETTKECVFLCRHDITMMLERMRKAQISFNACLVQGFFPSCS